ncbi:hypothetical protein [Rhodobacter sp. 24-YEA-8]|uniref:hypothetical protein n=1 Tax=Rhodobacter sp. 24-YEA-8 TaxID=1884310 RepID=UPI00115F92FC|nr:hypothetical protein [Rhodobacter sp. 24-YEA-8]
MAVSLLVAMTGEAEELPWDDEDNVPATAAGRASYAAGVLEVEAPQSLLAPDGGPSSEIMDFCQKTGVSLDFIFCGDVKGMLRAAYRREKGAATA